MIEGSEVELQEGIRKRWDLFNGRASFEVGNGRKMKC